MKALSETTNSAGQTVRRVQDSSGGVIELVLDTAGKVVSSKVVEPGKQFASIARTQIERERVSVPALTLFF